ncbi:MAG TPA: hypothetical protein VLA56_04840 [Pseudomonadales bacterium]|nr:hypothetical protein [Pseudomonadales bacterium]
MNATTKRNIPLIIAAALLASACVPPEAVAPGPMTRAPKNVDVSVRKDMRPASDACDIVLRTLGPKQPQGQGCNDVGEAIGVACGRAMDTIAWKALGAVEITSISFETATVANDDVCEDPAALVSATPVCKLVKPAGAQGDPLPAYKYAINFTHQSDECTVDPYIIVTRQ